MIRRTLALLIVLSGAISITAQASPADAVQQALDEFHANPELLYEYRVLGQHPDDLSDGGVVYLGMQSRATDEPVEGLLELMVVIPNDRAGWDVFRPAEPGFNDAYAALPQTIRDGIDVDAYKPPADPDRIPADPYGLPYPHNAFGTVTRSYDAHGTGTIDFDLTGREVAAAKEGVVVYANDTHTSNGPWWYWNTVIIQHAPDEYTLYGHLAPGSLPDDLRAACTADYDRLNCEFPVERGDVIGMEGNTGRSSDPHLHIEFGQSLNFVALPDISDDDGDGNRTEPVWTAFLYREQNAPVFGYAPEAVAAWEWGRVEQAGHFIRAPQNTNIVLNHTFDNGTSGWRASGQLNWTVEDSVLRALRLRTDEPPNFAAFYQFVNYSAFAGDAFEITIDLGNASGVDKTAHVELLSAAGAFHGAFGCTFRVPAGSPLTAYRVIGNVNNTWANALLRVTVNPADGSPALLVDNVALRRVTTPTETTICAP